MLRVNVAEVAKQRRMDKRDAVETLLGLAEHLPPRERMLLQQVFGRGAKVTEVAAISRKPARELRKQISHIIDRTRRPLFRFVVAHQDELPESLRLVARHVVLHGRPMRETADRLQISLHKVRRWMNALEGLAQVAGVERMRPPQRPRRAFAQR